MLVSMGVNTRPVSFSISEPSTIANTEALMQAVRFTFKDILKPCQEFYLQLKSGGAFYNLVESQEIADRSVLKAIIKPDTEVSCVLPSQVQAQPPSQPNNENRIDQQV